MKGLLDLIADIGFKGDRAKARDTLGRVYEYFLGKFAQAEGKLGGEFFTPRCIVRLLVEMLEPYEGRVYDPCCGSAGMFVQSERFVEAHGGQKTDISIFGQESNPTTWRLAHMNLAIRGIEANLGSQPADSFLRNLHPDLKADYILANPRLRPPLMEKGLPIRRSTWMNSGSSKSSISDNRLSRLTPLMMSRSVSSPVFLPTPSGRSVRMPSRLLSWPVVTLK